MVAGDGMDNEHNYDTNLFNHRWGLHGFFSQKKIQTGFRNRQTWEPKFFCFCCQYLVNSVLMHTSSKTRVFWWQLVGSGVFVVCRRSSEFCCHQTDATIERTKKVLDYHPLNTWILLHNFLHFHEKKDRDDYEKKSWLPVGRALRKKVKKILRKHKKSLNFFLRIHESLSPLINKWMHLR